MRSRFNILTVALSLLLAFTSLSAFSAPALADAPANTGDVLDRPARDGDVSPGILDGVNVAAESAMAAIGPVATINGSGWGHGIGLSQYGAQARALEGQTSDEIIETYYTGAARVGSFGVDGIPVPENIFTNVASDITSTTLTVLDGPASPHVGIAVTRLTGGSPEAATLASGDMIAITDTTPLAGDPGGCTATLTVSGTETVWDVGACDFNVALTSGATTPTDLVQATNCRTAYCTFGYGTALHIVDNGSSQRSVIDTYANGQVFPGFDLVVESTLDEYTRGIAEVPFSWDMAALQAQAIAARSYAATFVVSKDNTSEGCFCDVKNDSSYQVYAGWIGDKTMANRWDLAATTTAGMIVTDPSAPHSGIVRAFYTSSNGGASENNEDRWGGTPLSYLRSVPDPLSLLKPPNPYASWSQAVPLDAFAATFGLDTVTTVKIVNRFDSGVPKVVEVTGVKDGSPVTTCYGAYEPCVAPQNVTIGDGAGEIFDNLFGLRSSFIASIDIPGPPPPPPTEFDRWWGTDRYGTAVAVSQQGFASGANTVYVATGLNYPDALAAAPLAVKDPGPVLLVQKDAIPSLTIAEIQRLNPDRIVVLGGTAAISTSVAHDLESYGQVERIAGADRYATAADIARAAFGTAVDTVFIALGTSFPDALAAAPVAAGQSSPVLLVQPTSIPAATRAALSELQPATIVVVGGGTSVSSAVVDALASYASDEVVSIAGSNRYETSALLAAYAHPNGASSVFVATGTAYPDALTAGAVAGAIHAPIVLVRHDGLPASVATELVDLDPRNVTILGGTAAVSDAVSNSLVQLLGD